MAGRFFRADFDRDREFVVRRSIRINGELFDDGQALDKTAFTVRRLRQLYDSRTIDYAPEAATTGQREGPPPIPPRDEPLAPNAAPAPPTRRKGGSVPRRRFEGV